MMKKIDRHDLRQVWTDNSKGENMREIIREIKFRARNANSSSWVYGYFTAENNGNYIVNKDGKFPVIAGTVGQFTGCCDENGREIYEGDVVKTPLSWRKITFNHSAFCIEDDEGAYPIINFYSTLEVIGNIYENPELTVGWTI